MISLQKLGLAFVSMWTTVSYISNTKSESDCLVLQENIDRSSRWCDNWKIKLSISKCSQMTFTKQRKSFPFPYTVLGVPLVKVETVPRGSLHTKFIMECAHRLHHSQSQADVKFLEAKLSRLSSNCKNNFILL